MKKNIEKKEVSDKQMAAQFFKERVGHYNDVDPEARNYLVSSGSLLLDVGIEGGFGPGTLRFCGDAGGGKTSEATEVMDNFLRTVSKSKGLYIQSEGKDNTHIFHQKTFKTTKNPEEWDEGTCLILSSNVYEFVLEFIRTIIKNKEGIRYCIVIDSADALGLEKDMKKEMSDFDTMAGGAKIMSMFLKKMSLPLFEKGHLAIILSQRRESIKMDQFAPIDRNNQGRYAGGHALVHYPSWTLEFDIDIAKGDKILEKEKVLGHYASVKILKSTNETRGAKIKYPIRHTKEKGKSIWKEREIVELMIGWEFFEKKGSWYNIVDGDLLEYLKKEKIDIPLKLQGSEGYCQYLADNPLALGKLETFLKRNLEDYFVSD